MDVYGCLWMSMDVYGCLWMSMDVYGCLWMYMECLGMSVDVYGCLRIYGMSRDVYGCLWMSMDVNCNCNIEEEKRFATLPPIEMKGVTRSKLTIISESAICKKYLGQIVSYPASL